MDINYQFSISSSVAVEAMMNACIFTQELYVSELWLQIGENQILVSSMSSKCLD